MPSVLSVPSIRPLPSQVINFRVGLKILRDNPVHLNFSPVGTGKTFQALWNAIQLGLPVVIYAPSSMIVTWKKIIEEYNIEIVTTETRSRNGKVTENIEINTYNSASGYTPEQFIEKYKSVVRKGALFIFDESQKVKNCSAKSTQAIMSLVRYIVKVGGKSRVEMMSATFLDLPYQSTSILYGLGYVSNCVAEDPTVQRAAGVYDHIVDAAKDNRKELQEFLNSINTDGSLDKLIGKLDGLVTDKSGNPLNCIISDYNYCFNFLRLFVIPNIGTRMPAVRIPGIKQDVINLFVPISDPNYGKSLNNLATSAGDIEGKSAKRVGRVNFQETLRNIDSMKVPETLGLILHYLNKPTPPAMRKMTPDSCYKIIIGVGFIDSLAVVSAFLAMFSPLIMHGKVDKKERAEMVAAFQKPSRAHRVFVLTRETGSVGITLDDQHGAFPRIIISLVGTSIMGMIQFFGRAYRAKTLSDSLVLIIYGMIPEGKEGEGNSTEHAIRQRLMLKNDVVLRTIVHAKSPNDMYAEQLVTTLNDSKYAVYDNGELIDCTHKMGSQKNIADKYKEEIIGERKYILTYV